MAMCKENYRESRLIFDSNVIGVTEVSEQLCYHMWHVLSA